MKNKPTAIKKEPERVSFIVVRQPQSVKLAPEIDEKYIFIPKQDWEIIAQDKYFLILKERYET